MDRRLSCWKDENTKYTGHIFTKTETCDGRDMQQAAGSLRSVSPHHFRHIPHVGYGVHLSSHHSQPSWTPFFVCSLGPNLCSPLNIYKQPEIWIGLRRNLNLFPPNWDRISFGDSHHPPFQKRSWSLFYFGGGTFSSVNTANVTILSWLKK